MLSICFHANSFIRCGWKDVQAENRCFVSTIKLWWRVSSNLKLQIVENLIFKSFFSKYFLFYFSIQVPEQGLWCNHGSLGYRLTNWLQCWQPWPGLSKSTHTLTEGQIFDVCLCLQRSLGPSRIISKYERTTVLSERGSLLIYLDKVTGDVSFCSYFCSDCFSQFCFGSVHRFLICNQRKSHLGSIRSSNMMCFNQLLCLSMNTMTVSWTLFVLFSCKYIQ